MLGFPLGIRLADLIFPLSLCHHLDFCFHIAVAGRAGDMLSMMAVEKPAALQQLPTELKEASKALIFFAIPLHLPAPFPQPHTLKSQTTMGFMKQSFQRKNPARNMETVGRNKYILLFPGIAHYLSVRIPYFPTSLASSARGRQGAWCYIFILKGDSFPHKCFEEDV